MKTRYFKGKNMYSCFRDKDGDDITIQSIGESVSIHNFIFSPNVARKIAKQIIDFADSIDNKKGENGDEV
jgi:hypothetical protein